MKRLMKGLPPKARLWKMRRVISFLEALVCGVLAAAQPAPLGPPPGVVICASPDPQTTFRGLAEHCDPARQELCGVV